MILALTGARPNKLGGYKIPNPVFNKLCKTTEKFFLDHKPEKIISGVALGFDSYGAKIAIKLGIPFIAAVPFTGQEKMWPKESQEDYHNLLKKAAEIVIVSEGGYSVEKMQIRNQWMVDNSDRLLGAWDGTPGGTKNCLDYAKKVKRETYIIRVDKDFGIEKF